MFDRPGFPNPARIRIVLAEKGLEARAAFVSVDLIAAEHKQALLPALNPSDVFPVPELDDGRLISESTAITEYRDNLDGRPTLTGTTARKKALIHMMQRRAEAEVLDAAALYFPHATPDLSPHLAAYKSPASASAPATGRGAAGDGARVASVDMAERGGGGDPCSSADVDIDPVQMPFINVSVDAMQNAAVHANCSFQL